MGLDARKPVYGGLGTTNAQTSLRIRAAFDQRLYYSLIGKYHNLDLLQVESQCSS